MNFLGTLLNVVTESIAATEVTAAANPVVSKSRPFKEVY